MHVNLEKGTKSGKITMYVYALNLDHQIVKHINVSYLELSALTFKSNDHPTSGSEKDIFYSFLLYMCPGLFVHTFVLTLFG